MWAAPAASHTSLADAHRLAAALWSQAGPKQVSQLAALREKAAAAGAAAGQGGTTSNNIRGAKPNSNSRLQQQQQRQPGAVTAIQNRQQQSSAEAVPLLHSVWLNFQPSADSNAVLGCEWQLLHGQQWGWQDFGGVPVAIAPGSFVQVRG